MDLTPWIHAAIGGEVAQACDNIGAASLAVTGDLDRDFAAAYTAAKV